MSIEATQPEPIADAHAAACRYPAIVAAHDRGELLDAATLARVLELLGIDQATFAKDAADFHLAAELEAEAATEGEWRAKLHHARDDMQAMAARAGIGNARLASRRLNEVKRSNRRVFGWH